MDARADRETDMTEYFKFLDPVRPLLVTPANPPREDLDGMDHERCAALHNAILKHGWVRSGRSAAEFDRVARPVIDMNSKAQSDMHPSIRAFSAAALTLENTADFKDQKMFFFFYVDTLSPSADWHDHDEGDLVTLYTTLMAHATKVDGLNYSQNFHTAAMHFDICDDLKPDPEHAWPPLESILTVWIEMILCHKIVAIPDDVGRDRCEHLGNGNLRAIPGPKTDVKTGASRYSHDTEPWTVQPYTTEDVTRTVATWDTVVACIEHKIGLEPNESTASLLDGSNVAAASMQAGFLRDFLALARKPRFVRIAPGLEISDPQALHSQPHIGRSFDTSSILLFRGEDVVNSARLSHPLHMYGEVPKPCQCGLYVVSCDRGQSFPQEDGIKLVLPYAFEEKFGVPTGHAKLSDLTPALSYDNLLQVGVNPYNSPHPAKLRGFLDIVLANVQSDHWHVDEFGVAGGIDAWKAANTEEHWEKYIVPVGPGAYW